MKARSAPVATRGGMGVSIWFLPRLWCAADMHLLGLPGVVPAVAIHLHGSRQPEAHRRQIHRPRPLRLRASSSSPVCSIAIIVHVLRPDLYSCCHPAPPSVHHPLPAPVHSAPPPLCISAGSPRSVHAGARVMYTYRCPYLYVLCMHTAAMYFLLYGCTIHDNE